MNERPLQLHGTPPKSEGEHIEWDDTIPDVRGVYMLLGAATLRKLTDVWQAVQAGDDYDARFIAANLSQWLGDWGICHVTASDVIEAAKEVCGQK